MPRAEVYTTRSDALCLVLVTRKSSSIRAHVKLQVSSCRSASDDVVPAFFVAPVFMSLQDAA